MPTARRLVGAAVDDPERIVDHVRALLDGDVLIVPPPGRDIPADIRPPLPGTAVADRMIASWDDIALALPTSGTTGDPVLVALTRTALLASAAATRTRLGSQPARWLLALPVRYIAGIQVVVRAVLDGADPLILAGGFDVRAFASATEALDHSAELRTALVPTQLARVLADPAATAAARAFSAILLGGALTPRHLLAKARDEGLRIVTTYGASETAGGCVYDGVPLKGYDVSVVDGRIALAGPSLALGYLSGDGVADVVRTEQSFAVDDAGTAWFTSSDLGHVESGALHVDGRADHVIVSGGIKVNPASVEEFLTVHVGVADALVFGIDDEEWGQRVIAAIEYVERPLGPDDVVRLRAAIKTDLGPASVPRTIAQYPRFPRLATGKVDRRALLSGWPAVADDPDWLSPAGSD